MLATDNIFLSIDIINHFVLSEIVEKFAENAKIILILSGGIGFDFNE